MRTLPFALVLMLLSGCGNPFVSSPSGTFTATVTGAVSATLEGRAEVDNPTLGVSESYAIALTPADGRAIYFYSGSRVRAGTYAILPFDVQTPRTDYIAIFMSQGNGGAYTSVSGEMQIVRASNGALRGTFHFEGEDRPDRPRIAVSGTFTLR